MKLKQIILLIALILPILKLTIAFSKSELDPELGLKYKINCIVKTTDPFEVIFNVKGECIPHEQLSHEEINMGMQEEKGYCNFNTTRIPNKNLNSQLAITGIEVKINRISEYGKYIQLKLEAACTQNTDKNKTNIILNDTIALRDNIIEPEDITFDQIRDFGIEPCSATVNVSCILNNINAEEY